MLYCNIAIVSHKTCGSIIRNIVLNYSKPGSSSVRSLDLGGGNGHRFIRPVDQPQESKLGSQ